MVSFERVGSAAVVTIDRQERRNAVDGPTAAALLEAYERFAGDDDARVMVLTGAGDQAFCAGADLKALETLDPDAPAGPMGFSRLTPAKPAIAAIGGGGGAGGGALGLGGGPRGAPAPPPVGRPGGPRGGAPVGGGPPRAPRVGGP